MQRWPDPPDSSGSPGPEEFVVDLDDDAWVDEVREAERAAPLGKLGRFELQHEVHRGGQGIVYRATDPATRRPVAVKRLVAGGFATPSARRRFAREIEAVMTLDHPGIVRVHDVDAEHDQPILAMEWIDGVPVTTWAWEAGSNRAIIGLFVRICAAVHHAHQRGVIHRDLKPSNIFVDTSGAPHVLDFGIAKLDQWHGLSRATVTQAGQFLGTPAYASPEQVRGRPGDVDVRTDVYALGIVLYECLVGRMPYDVEGSLADIFHAIEHTSPTRPTRAIAGIDRELEAIILRTIAKAPADRYQSVESLRADLMRYLRGDPLEARGHHPLYVMSRVVRRHKGPVLVASAFVVLTLAFGITMGFMYRASEREAARAEHVQQFLQDMLVSASPFRTSANLTVVEVLRQAAERIPQDLAGHPEAEAGVRFTIGQVYAGLWMWEDAEPHLRRALDLSRGLHGDRHEDVAACLSLLGRALTFRGDPGSIDLQREALDVRRDRFGTDHALVAEAHGNLGFAIWKTASPAAPMEAELHYRQAMRTYRAAHRAAGESDEALNADRARITYSYAAFCLDHDRLVEADRLFAQASRLYRAMSGSGDVYMTECLDAYATCLFRLGRYDETAALLRESIALRPPGFASGRLVEAVWLLGTIERLSGSWDEALRHYDLSLAMQCEILSTRDENAPLRLRLLGSALREPARADALYGDVFRLLRETQPDAMRQLAAAMLDVANALRGQERAAVAEPLLRECVDLLGEPAYEQSYLAGLAHSEYGACLMDLSRGRAAGAHLLEGCWILQQRTSRADPYFELAVRRVVQYYEFNGQTADAARYEALLDQPAPGPARLTE